MNPKVDAGDIAKYWRDSSYAQPNDESSLWETYTSDRNKLKDEIQTIVSV